MKHFLQFILLSFVMGFLTSCTVNNPNTPPYNPNNPYNQASTGYPPYNPDPNNPNNQASTGYPPDPNNPGPQNFPPGPQNPIANPNERVLGFPYELIPDTLTALTCPNSVQIAGRPFTLSLGAYVNPGLQLSQSFFEDNNITANTPDQKIRQILDRSPFRNAQARLALQDESDLRVIFGNPGGNGRSLSAFFPPFNNPSTLDHLSKGKAVFTARSSSSSSVQTGGRFEASLPITGQQLSYFAEGLAPNAPGVHILTLTYSLDRKNPILSDSGLPYGRGYKLKFANYRANYLVDIEEDNLAETKKDGEWTCHEHLTFSVHRAESKESSPFNKEYNKYKKGNYIPEGTSLEGYCDTRNSSLSRSESKFFSIVFGTNDLRNLPFNFGKTVLLTPEGEDFRTSESCIKFKRPGCYLQKGYYRIEFDKNKMSDCVPLDSARSTEDFYRVCPAYLSACYRLMD